MIMRIQVVMESMTNTINAEMFNTLLTLQSTMSSEINQIVTAECSIFSTNVSGAYRQQTPDSLETDRSLGFGCSSTTVSDGLSWHVVAPAIHPVACSGSSGRRAALGRLSRRALR